jgi:5-hydroxyisourate hydrolase-like protein (transthyretin family)
MLSKTIKKLHFEQDSRLKSIHEEREQVIVSPFEIEEEPSRYFMGRESRVNMDKFLERLPKKLHLKKESFAEEKS